LMEGMISFLLRDITRFASPKRVMQVVWGK